MKCIIVFIRYLIVFIRFSIVFIQFGNLFTQCYIFVTQYNPNQPNKVVYLRTK